MTTAKREGQTMLRTGTAFAVVFGLATGASAQLSPVDRGVICLADGTMTYVAEGPLVADDYNYVDALRGEPNDPFAPEDRPSAVTEIDLTLSECRWIRGEELEACFPGEEPIRYLVEGLTVSDTQCAARTFQGKFQQVDEDGNPLFVVIGDEPPKPVCSGSFQCGHAPSEIAIDVVRVVPGISDPGSVDAEPNNGRGESPPLSEQCTLELLTDRNGDELATSRFGLASFHFVDEGNGAEELSGFVGACADDAQRPASARFTGLVGSSALGFP